MSLTPLEKQLRDALEKIREKANDGQDGGTWATFRSLTSIIKQANTALAAAREKDK